MENANNLSKNFDASVKKIRPPLPHWLGVRRHFERFSTRGQQRTTYSTEREKREEETKRKRIKMRKGQRKWHIFVLTGGFCCYFTQ
jgi:hypothetical protein